MKLQGILSASLPFGLVHIHAGQKDNADFSQLSFPSLGDMNNDSEETVLTEASVQLLFRLNDMPCRIHLEKAADGFTGSIDLTSPGFALHEEITASLIADAPAFAPHHCIVPEENIQKLKAHDRYTPLPCQPVLTHELNNPEVLAFIRSRGIEVENHHDFDTLRHLMQQVSRRIRQDGVNYCHDREHRGTIAQFLHAEAQGNVTNCRGAAIILCGVLRAYGFAANYVECWPAKDSDPDIHVVCEAYAPDLGKTVLLDPSGNLFYTLDGTVLNLLELKAALVQGRQEQIRFNADAAHGDEQDPGMQMLAYMSKNLVILCKCLHSCETMEMTAEDNSLCLAPLDLLHDPYPESTRRTANPNEFFTYC